MCIDSIDRDTEIPSFEIHPPSLKKKDPFILCGRQVAWIKASNNAVNFGKNFDKPAPNWGEGRGGGRVKIEYEWGDPDGDRLRIDVGAYLNDGKGNQLNVDGYYQKFGEENGKGGISAEADRRDY